MDEKPAWDPTPPPGMDSDAIPATFASTSIGDSDYRSTSNSGFCRCACDVATLIVGLLQDRP